MFVFVCYNVMIDCVIHVFLQLLGQMLSFILSEVLYYEIKNFLVYCLAPFLFV